jgi:hypothetical protein
MKPGDTVIITLAGNTSKMGVMMFSFTMFSVKYFAIKSKENNSYLKAYFVSSRRIKYWKSKKICLSEKIIK